ncbi:helix-loop-helix DNA-binding domain containing protein [Grosmannia clavigera kw1407]|uniref:Helix-loop-helix DNA-binding domain containing protein n=1 Tax=Grosmannia clavigera (strain kw1407 / UAMH 11150) TaxID=655863 RepID=F0XMJ2_GROCL|nr:helix-loop-helix DNA-binding domain containing protein [Grosmannia clavigera kw1407]EFX01152.1 helix-loop-helix DNA-binding domain containing protein [Grosmannia clavigera kw1407]
MDPNLLRNLGYFSVPNNQTLNPVDQSGSTSALGSAPSQPQSLWDESALAAATLGRPKDASLSGSPSISLDSLAASTPGSNFNLFSPIMPSSPMFGQTPRPVIPPRNQRTREGHDKKSSGSLSQTKPPTPQRSATLVSQTPSSGQKKREDSFDDSALDKALSDDGFSYSSINLADHMSKIESMPPPEIPPREGLYSTPLSWERPQMGLRLDSLISLQTPSLSDDEQRRLIAIAMNSGATLGGLGGNINANFGMQGNFLGPSLGSGLGSRLGSGLGPVSLSQLSNSSGSMMNPMITPSNSSTAPPTSPTLNPKSEKGKEREREKPKSADRTAHNDIERKYRTNLKDKIAELRDAVPALRTIPENAIDDGDDSNQPGRGPKVSKVRYGPNEGN